MKLSIIIPCYNELNTIETVVETVKKINLKDFEIIIIDDCSNDGTRELLIEKIESKVDRVIYHDKNKGKGAALQTGFNNVKGDVIVVQDADLEYDPNELPMLLQPILDNKADVVYGSRFMGNRPHRVLYFWHMVGNRLLTLMSNMFTNLNLTDMETCYKMFKTSLIKDLTLKEKRFGIEPEITAKLAKQKVRFYEMGISYYGRTYQEGKKINWKDGFRAIYAILKYNLL